MLPGDPNPSGELSLPDHRNRPNHPHHNAYEQHNERDQAWISKTASASSDEVKDITLGTGRRPGSFWATNSGLGARAKASASAFMVATDERNVAAGTHHPYDTSQRNDSLSEQRNAANSPETNDAPHPHTFPERRAFPRVDRSLRHARSTSVPRQGDIAEQPPAAAQAHANPPTPPLPYNPEHAAQHERQQAHLDAVHRVMQHQAAQQQTVRPSSELSFATAEGDSRDLRDQENHLGAGSQFPSWTAAQQQTQTKAQAEQARMQAKAQQAALERAHVQQQVDQARHLPPQRFSSHLQLAQQPAPQQVHLPVPRPAVSRASMSGRDSGEYSRSASPWAAPHLVPDGRPWSTTAAPHSRPSSGMGSTNFRSRSGQGGYHRNGAPLPTDAAQLQAAAYPTAAQVHSNSHQTAPSVPQLSSSYGVNPMPVPSNQQAGSSRLPANQPARPQASRPTQHQAGDAPQYPSMLVNSLRTPGGAPQETQSPYYGEQGRGVIRGPEALVAEPPKILSRDERYNKGDFMVVTSDKVEFWVERHHMTHARYVSFQPLPC